MEELFTGLGVMFGLIGVGCFVWLVLDAFKRMDG